MLYQHQPSSPILETIFQPHQPAPIPHIDSIAASSAFSSPHNIIFPDLLDPQQLVVAIRTAESLNLWIEGKIYRIARGFLRWTQQKHHGVSCDFFHDPFLGLKQDLRTNRSQRDLTWNYSMSLLTVILHGWTIQFIQCYGHKCGGSCGFSLFLLGGFNSPNKECLPTFTHMNPLTCRDIFQHHGTYNVGPPSYKLVFKPQ